MSAPGDAASTSREPGAALPPEFVLLGNLLVDDLVFPDGRTRMAQAGGAILYASLASALWGARVGVVSLRGEDYPESALELLRRRGVGTEGIVPLGRPGVRTWLLYEGRVRRVVHRLGCPSHEEVSPEPGVVPASWRGARVVHLGPMPFAQQARQVASLGADGSFVSVDPHELVTEQSLPRWREVLAQADAFWPSEDELRLDGAQTDPHAALRRLAGGRLKYVAWKRGLRGGILYDVRADAFHAWEARTDGVVDPTGAGDAFVSGFLTAMLEGRPLAEWLQRGVVTASYAIGAWGPAGLLEVMRADAEARRRAWFEVETTR